MKFKNDLKHNFMKTRTIYDHAKPLFQNEIWSIEKISDFELAITDGNQICYAYISEDFKTLVVDRKNYPKYIEKKAIQLAKKHISSIYDDNNYPEKTDINEYSNGIY